MRTLGLLALLSVMVSGQTPPDRFFQALPHWDEEVDVLDLMGFLVWAPVSETGQTTCYDASGNEISCAGTGQDGDLRPGVAWPNPRFTDNGDGTVTDNLTGLTGFRSPTAGEP